MKVTEKTGKSVFEAVEAALEELNVTREQVEIEVLEEPSKGLFGLGAKLARVRVTLPEPKAPGKAENFLREVFLAMGISVQVKADDTEETLFIDLSGEDIGVLIGRRGDTLDALQYLVNLVANKNAPERKRIVLDAEGYRKRRETTLQRLAERLADKALRKGREVILEPMSPQERRIIHTALQGNDNVSTFSQGEEPYRKVVISPRK